MLGVSALILAGGKATRFGGIAKHALVVEGKTIFERQVAVLAPRVDETLVSGVEIAGYRTVIDELGSGPLAGIHAGLLAAMPLAGIHTGLPVAPIVDKPTEVPADDRAQGLLRETTKAEKQGAEPPPNFSVFAVSRKENDRPDAWLLVVAGDMPNITGELIDALLAARAPDLDAVAYQVGGRPEPLCSLLHIRTLAAVERRLVAGLYKASGLLTDEGLRVRWLTDADPEALRNLNSPSDLPK